MTGHAQTLPVPLRRTRRSALGRAGAIAPAALVTACGGGGQAGEASRPAVSGPKEVAWSCYQLGEAREGPWNETLRLAEKATGVKITNVWEAGQGYWDKRQAEAAGGVANADVMINQVNWVIPGGLSGLFVDHAEYLRRDKVDARQYYKADWESWQWKGKQWAIPMQAGGEVVLYNRKLFDAKGVRRPHKDWTFDEFLDACRKLNDPTANRFAVTVGANGLNQMMGTFVLAFGGKLLNEARDRALYGDDAKALQGAEFDVDLHVKHRVTPSGDALLAVPAGKQPIELELAAMEFNGIFRHTNVRAAIGAEHLDFAPPPKGPTGLQSASMWGNAWSILALSRAKEAAWQVLRWLHTREGMLAPQITAIAWPPLIWAASAPQWQDQFKGTRIAEATRVWETGGHDIIVVPEGNEAWTTMNAPVQRALRGEVGPRDAMRESATALNELFGRRPPAWR